MGESRSMRQISSLVSAENGTGIRWGKVRMELERVWESGEKEAPATSLGQAVYGSVWCQRTGLPLATQSQLNYSQLGDS